jgi:hypothetical protein
VGDNSAPVTRLIWRDVVFTQNLIQDSIEFWVMNVMDMRKQMMRNVIVEAAKNEIRRFTKRVHVI